MPDEWLLVKRDLYYRPEGKGYTGIRDHAGRYSHDEALATAKNGVSMVKLEDAPEFSKACYDDLARDHLAKQRDEARAGLVAAVRAANLALFVINKAGVMPNSSWESGFKKDMATAHAALAATDR